MTHSEADRAERLVGYRFNNKDLLDAAFTHSSYVNEHKAVSNERLEFLGDCVLNFLVGVELFSSSAEDDEGSLSARRAATVSRGPLSRLVDKYGFIDCLRVGAGVDKHAFSDKARSDLFEAIVGALYLDGGLDACRKFLNDKFFGAVEPEHDYKSELQTLAAAHGVSRLEYVSTESGDGFTCTVELFGKRFNGRGKTKHAAEIDAARSALMNLNESSSKSDKAN